MAETNPASNSNLFSRFSSFFLGSKSFYKSILVIAVPIVIQNLITNIVSLLDNIMVGQTGTDAMNGVSIVNQILFVYILCVWGASCGAGIYTTQFFGKKDVSGVRHTFRAKLIETVFVTAIFIAILLWKGDFFISKFLHETNEVGNAENTLRYAMGYMKIVLFGLIPQALTFSYANTLRCCNETSVPMKAGLASVAVNIILNYIFIFGHLGFPAMGPNGAALATVVARFVEAFIVIIYAHSHSEKYPFIKGAYSSLKIPRTLMKKIIITGIPLAMNETFWALGLTLMNQNYSLRGLNVVAALNISSTIVNLFNVFLFALSEALGIKVGQYLGAKEIEKAKASARKIIFASVVLCIGLGFAMSLFKGAFPSVYNTEDDVKHLASNFILVASIFLPVLACVHGCYFTIRTGGKTFVTFLFDSVFICCISLPVAFALTHFTAMSIFAIYIVVSSLDVLKAIIGVILVKKGLWINVLTN